MADNHATPRAPAAVGAAPTKAAAAPSPARVEGPGEVAAPVITLLTDFGLRDIYVGVMHGVILGIAPEARIVDLSHDVAPQSVAEAAFLLDSAAPYFPWGTIHVAVVDPGVGTERRILCARTTRATYLAPDNGLLARVLERDPPSRLISIENPAFFLPRVSSTFHGRDKFAPVAARLALGLDPRELGPEVHEIRPLPMPRPREIAPGRLAGEVIHVDRFGNVVTNVGEAYATRIASVSLGGHQVRGPVCRAYGDRGEGESLVIFGSSGFLEVSINGGDAARTLGVKCGDPVEVALAGLGSQEVVSAPRARGSPRSSP